MLKWNLRHLNLNNYFYNYHCYLNFNYNYFMEKFNFTDCPSDFHSKKKRPFVIRMYSYCARNKRIYFLLTELSLVSSWFH